VKYAFSRTIWTQHSDPIRANQPFPYQGNHPSEPESSNQEEAQVTLVHEHGWYISFTLCRGCTLSPRVMFPHHAEHCLGAQWGHTTRPLQSPLQVYVTPTSKVSPSYISQRPQGTPLEPHKPSRCSITWRKLINWPGHTILTSWLRCYAGLHASRTGP
jgi:hypothetical protein